MENIHLIKDYYKIYKELKKISNDGTSNPIKKCTKDIKSHLSNDETSQQRDEKMF